MAPMAIALRCLAIAALGLFLLPASASADADVTRDASGILTIDDEFGGAAADDITISQTGTSTVVTLNTAGQLFSSDASCAPPGNTQISCTPAATSIAVDMGGL